jgi:hypothetical protein
VSESAATGDKRAAILAAGSDITGPAAAASAGLLLGGPAGAVVGAAAAAPATSALRRLLGELAGRVFGAREEARIGTVLLSAEAEVRAQLAAGRQLRDDGFFGAVGGRDDAEEIAEAAVMSAQRSPQEVKAPLIGKMLGRLQFDARVSPAYGHLLIREVESLTYRQLCCLALFNFGIRDSHNLPEKPLEGVTDPLDPRIGLLQEILDLSRRTMIQQRAEDHPGTDLLTYVPGISPPRLEVTGLGGWLTELMDLPTSIPPSELEGLAATLRGEKAN